MTPWPGASTSLVLGAEGGPASTQVTPATPALDACCCQGQCPPKRHVLLLSTTRNRPRPGEGMVTLLWPRCPFHSTTTCPAPVPAPPTPAPCGGWPGALQTTPTMLTTDAPLRLPGAGLGRAAWVPHTWPRSLAFSPSAGHDPWAPVL